MQDLQRRLQTMEMGRLHRLQEELSDLPHRISVRLHTGLGGLDLRSLNPDLGEYFGTTEGVLVLEVPEEFGIDLRAGDVIQSIDGREVRSPSHAIRILRSYAPDEEISLEIVRQGDERTVEGRVPEDWSRFPG
jgi:S1-C subfamily serine protease